MKILLIYPYCLEDRLHEEDAAVVPIGLYYIGAFMKERGYDAKILNFHGLNNEKAKIREILAREKPDIIGFSILNANRWGGIEIAKIAKKINPDIKIIFGGVSATFLWKHFLTWFKEVDFIVMGEGELPFYNLVCAIEKGAVKSLETIKGIGFRKDGKIISTPEPDPIEDLDSLPNPAKYFMYNHLALTRGCASNCIFCGSPKFWGRKVRFHSPRYFLDQLESLYNRGIRFFYVSDDTFTLNKRYVIEICKKIIEKKLDISWAAISRVDLVNDEVLKWMRKAGCIQISFGIESGSEKIRKFLNKNIDDKSIETAFALSAKWGIMARAYFIYGCPGESDETIRQTMALIKKIKPLATIFYILDVFPGTALYENFKKLFNITDDIWLNRIEDILYFEYDKNLSEEMILGFGKKLRNFFYGHLHEFTENIDLADEKDMYQLHGDFLSRLAMTLSHGEYRAVSAIRDKDKIAGELFLRALNYYPERRAYLGLGMLEQKKGRFDRAILFLEKGLKHFPDDEELNLCMAITCMNLGEFDKALSYLMKFKTSDRVSYYINQCYKAREDIKARESEVPGKRSRL